MDIFKPKVIGAIKQLVEKNKNDNHPPKNIITVKALIRIIELYSARKKSANPIAAYSTL